MTRLKKIGDGGWLLFVAMLICLIAVVGGFRVQDPNPGVRDFVWSEPHCWAYPCLIDHRPKWSWERHGTLPLSESVATLAVMPEDTIVTAHRDGRVHLWTAKGKRKRELTLSGGAPVTALAVGPDHTIVTGHRDGRIRQWDVDLRQVRELRLPEDASTTAVAVGPDRTIMATGRRGWVYLWTAKGEQKDKLLVRTPVTAMAMTSDNIIVTTDRDGQVHLWTNRGKRWSKRTLSVGAPVTALAVGPDRTIVTGHRDGQVNLWTTRGKRKRKQTLSGGVPITALAVGPDHTIVTGHRDGRVRQWDAGRGQVRELRLPEGASITAVAMTTDNTIVVARSDGTMIIHVGLIAALWTWIIIALAIIGLLFFVERVRRIRSEEPVSTGLESDKPADGPTKVTKSMSDMAKRIASLLSNPHSHPPLTICVDGEWGRGKSSLMNLVARQLRKNDCTCVFFNAWHHQNENHLFAALMEQIRKSWRPRSYMSWLPVSAQKLSKKSRLTRHWENFLFYGHLWLRRFYLAPISFLLFLIVLCLSTFILLISFEYSIQFLFQIKIFNLKTPEAANQAPGILLATIMSGSAAICLFLWNSPWNPFKAFPVSPASLVTTSIGWFQFAPSWDRLSFRYRFQDAFQEVCNLLGYRHLVIIIDDLDRCDGDHIMELLEAINFLTSSGSCFVLLAMDENRVKRVLDLRYKDATQQDKMLFSADKYLEKIINLTVEVPHPSAVEVHEIRKSEQS